MDLPESINTSDLILENTFLFENQKRENFWPVVAHVVFWSNIAQTRVSQLIHLNIPSYFKKSYQASFHVFYWQILLQAKKPCFVILLLDLEQHPVEGMLVMISNAVWWYSAAAGTYSVMLCYRAGRWSDTEGREQPCFQNSSKMALICTSQGPGKSKGYERRGTGKGSQKCPWLMSSVFQCFNIGFQAADSRSVAVWCAL